jgi:hypothetical protein
VKLDALSPCGHPYIPYDEQRVDGLVDRLRQLVAEHGAPTVIRWSPDIDHQITDGLRGIWSVKGLRRVETRCDASLPPNSIVFDAGLLR